MDPPPERSDRGAPTAEYEKALKAWRDGISGRKEKLEETTRLYRTHFIDAYLERWDADDSEVVAARRELLKRLMDPETFQRLERVPATEAAVPPTFLTFDRAGDAEDRNYAYHRSRVGPALLGFLGSPNLRHSGGVTCLAVSRDGKTLVSGSSDNTFKLWDVASGRLRHTFELGWIPVQIAFSKARLSVFATANLNGTVTLFDLAADPRCA